MHEFIINNAADFQPQVTVDTPAAPKKAKAAVPSVADQLIGIYTAPKALFQKLADAPSWGRAFTVMLAVGLVMITIWASKVDVDAMQRPALEATGKLSAEQIDQTIAMGARFVVPVSAISYVVRSFAGVLLLAFVFWAIGSIVEDENRKPSYRRALSAATLPNLVLLPYMLLITAICLIRDVGGMVPEKLAPSSLAYYLRPDNPKLYAVLSQLDLFNIAYFALMYLAIRYTMRFSSAGAGISTAFAAVLIVGMKVLFWS